jgi:hypothetical protein
MASRVLATSGGDHTTLADWASWATNPANFGGAANWDDPTNGGDQILRVANSTFTFTSSQVLDLDALVTATYYKATVRPNTEGSVTYVGAKVAADGTLNLSSVDKNPRFSNSGYSHAYMVDLSSCTAVEWRFEGLAFILANHRTGCLRFASGATRHVYIDRCIFADRTGGGEPVFNGGPTGAAAGRIHLRSCVVDCLDNVNGMVFWQACSGAFILGNTIRIGSGGTTFLTGAGSQIAVKAYGNAIYHTSDGSSAFTGTGISAADFPTNYNVSNLTGTNWTSDFDSAGDVNNSTIANMFVSSTNQYPKSAGALHGVVSWAGLPSDVQAVWPTLDFIGNTVTQSGSFSAGAFYVAGTTTYNETISDGATNDHSFTIAGTFVPTLSDATTGAESFLAGLSISMSLSDSVTSAESVSAAVTFGPVLSEVGAAGESHATTAVMQPTTSDSGTAGESYATTVAFAATIVDSGAGAESFGAAATLIATLTDAGSGGESFIGGLLLSEGFTDSATAAESLTYSLIFGAVLSDSSLVGESFGAAATFAANFLDALSAGDSFVGGMVFSETITAGGTTGESFADLLALYGIFSVLTVVSTVGRIELVSSGPASVFSDVTEQPSRA